MVNKNIQTKLFKKVSIGDWYKSYNKHYFVELWCHIDTDKQETDENYFCGFSITFHQPCMELSDGARDYANAIEKFNTHVKTIKGNNFDNFDVIEDNTRWYNLFVNNNDIEKMQADYDAVRKIFVEKFCKANKDKTISYAEHFYRTCAQSKIDEYITSNDIKAIEQAEQEQAENTCFNCKYYAKCGSVDRTEKCTGYQADNSNRKYLNCELSKQDANKLKQVLKLYDIRYSASECYNLIHFEILVNESEKSFLNDWIDVNL